MPNAVAIDFLFILILFTCIFDQLSEQSDKNHEDRPCTIKLPHRQF